MKTYNYNPIESPRHTRLLKLKASPAWPDDLIGEILHISLDNPPEYEALSYVWASSCDPNMAPRDRNAPLKASLYYPETKKLEIYEISMNQLIASPHPQFHQLFWSMGGYKPDGEILLDGQAVTLGAELRDALTRVRLPDKDRLIWIDALCIDQLNIIERNAHVRNMGIIYEKANHVVIWLGENIMAIEDAFFTVNHLNQIIQSYEDMELHSGAIRRYFLADPEVRKMRWDALAGLTHRAWFGRVWVLQEIVNAKKATIYASDISIDWQLFASVLNWLHEFTMDSPIYARGDLDAIPTIKMIQRLFALKADPEKPPLPSLIEVLSDTRFCKSSFPIDKVYGVLGMVSREEAKKIEINYDLDPVELFTRIATSELLGKRGLEILYYCNKHSEESAVKCPSWVPNWTEPCHHQNFSALGYQSSASKASVASFQIKGNHLVIRGRILDTIKAVELLRNIPKKNIPKKLDDEALSVHMAYKHVEVQFEDYFEATAETRAVWVRNAISIAFPDKTITAKSLEKFWRSFCCNQFAVEINGSTMPSLEWGQTFSVFLMGMSRSKEETDKLTDAEKTANYVSMMRFFEFVSSWTRNRRFIRSVQGRFGWVPDQAREGDIICVINGLAVPLVLRESQEGGFELIGDCYLHGIMDGEGMELDIEEQDFNII